ncbi:anthranilate phosphoribosyltransferase [Synechococcus sp. M16CYN]|uniref:anthranilate phosphoribosyltransferase n=1 Tax=Synechococcus sp. M16CYN TaxID=3103139 RepID=UPI003341AB96
MSSELRPWPRRLESLLQGHDLTANDASSLMRAWLAGDLSPAQTGAFLAGLRAKGIVADELVAMAIVLRKACPLPCDRPDLTMVDTCGTGGDGADTFNVSTAVAFTTASCGVNVAKHGNRSASGNVGSADVLEGLGVNLGAPLASVVDAISKTGITFLFAPAWHSALVNLAPLRHSLGVRTVFNLLGPLVNPLQPQAQVLGVAQADLLNPMASALSQLHLKRAIVVHGSGGLDEASLSGVNELRLIEAGRSIASRFISPNDLGFEQVPLEALRGGNLAENQRILENVLKGQATPAQMDVVAFNTALALWVAGSESDLKIASRRALQTLRQGLPWQKLQDLRQALSHGNGQ